MRLYPNPASNSLYLGFDTEITGLVTINIIDAKGVTVKVQAETMAAGRQSRQMDISTLPSGTYIVSVGNDATMTQQKFIKQ
jgi:hypothetical protein